MEPRRRICKVNIPSRGTQKECMCLADPWVEVNSPVFSSVAHLVLRQSFSSSPFHSLKVLLLFSAGIVCGRWKFLYLTQIIGMSFLTASFLKTIPWPWNENKPLARPSDKGRTIIHCMCVNIHWCVCVCVCGACICVCACIHSCRPTCKGQCVQICRCVMDYHRSYQACWAFD